MNIPTNILRADLSASEKLTLSFLFYHWLNLNNTNSYGKINLPKQREISKAIGLELETIKKIPTKLVNKGYLILDKDRNYTVAIPNNKGELLEITDPSAFTKLGGSRAWEDIGFYVNVSDEIISSNEVDSRTKLMYAEFKFCFWNSKANKMVLPVAHYSRMKKIFGVSEKTCYDSMKRLKELGLIKYTVQKREEGQKGMANMEFAKKVKEFIDFAVKTAEENIKIAEEVEKKTEEIKKSSKKVIAKANDLQEKEDSLTREEQLERIDEIIGLL